MVIQHICIRCRQVSGSVEIQGGSPHLLELTMLPTMSRTLCPRCGGWVYAVKEDEVLPYEFVPTWQRVFVAACWTAVKALFVVFPILLLIIITNPIDSSLFKMPWLGKLAVIIGGFGFLMTWVQSWIVKRYDVNEPHKKGMLPFGESAAMFAMLLPIVVITVLIFFYVIPFLADDGTELRGGIVRVLCGIFAGIILTSMSMRELFRQGRRPPTEDKQKLFGKKSNLCDSCSRPFEKIINPAELMMGMGVMMRTDQLMSGREGVGKECVKCLRTICSNCETFDMKCKCGSVKFRSVHLVYR